MAAAASASAETQSALGAAQEAVEAVVSQQLAELANARKEHSHSDVLLPPDLCARVLSPASSALHKRIAELVAPLDQPQGSDDQEDAGQSSSQTKEGSAALDLVRLDLFNVLARRLVFSDGLDASSLSKGLAPDQARRLYDRLDVVLSLENHDLADPSLSLSLHHDVLESMSVTACRQHFDYIESRISELTRGLVPSKGKGLVLLRLCNELLRRLSKPSPTHTVFAGRILSFLSKVFPLGERSGVNLRGDFNVDNKTSIDVREENDDNEEITTTVKDVESADTNDRKDTTRESVAEAQRRRDEYLLSYAKTREFYEAFWGVQQYFSNPAAIVDEKSVAVQAVQLGEDVSDPVPDGAKGQMQAFRRATRRIFDIFAAVQRREKELAGQSTNDVGSTQTPSKRSRSEGSSLAGRDVKAARRIDDAPLTVNDVDESARSEESEFFPKYLTGRNLLEYELRDASFRRHILVQYLIFFQYLLSFSSASKEQVKAWKNVALSRGMSYTLDEADDRWLREVWRETLNLIRDTSTEGRAYAFAVHQILRHEERWVTWKTANCPPIDRPAMTAAQMTAFNDARKAAKRPLRSYPFPLGTAALSKLWEDGVRPPEPSTRMMEDESGMEVQVQTDGLDELEMGPQIPSLESYAAQIQKLEAGQATRRKELDFGEPRRYVITSQIPSAIRQQERERVKREDADPKLASLAQQRTVAAWRALRLARNEHLNLFGKIECESATVPGATAVGMRIDDITGLMTSVEKQEKGIPIVPSGPPVPPKEEKVEVNVKAEAGGEGVSTAMPPAASAEEAKETEGAVKDVEVAGNAVTETVENEEAATSGIVKEPAAEGTTSAAQETEGVKGEGQEDTQMEEALPSEKAE